MAAHPGLSATNLQTGGPLVGLPQPVQSVLTPVLQVGSKLVGQSDRAGALPQLYAATMSDVAGGEFFGPAGVGEMRGAPKRVGTRSEARDEELARGLWERSEQLTGVSFDALAGA